MSATANLLPIKRGDTFTLAGCETTDETGGDFDFTGLTEIKCQITKDKKNKKAPRKNVTVTVTANTGTVLTYTLSMTAAQTELLDICTYEGDVQVTLADGVTVITIADFTLPISADSTQPS